MGSDASSAAGDAMEVLQAVPFQLDTDLVLTTDATGRGHVGLVLVDVSPAAVATTELRPFLDAVHSEDAGAAVTSASLAALHEVMSLMGSSLPDAMARCRFEVEAEVGAEETVLMRMLHADMARSSGLLPSHPPS
ncbi:hypothetical protein E2562_032382 [Oryza meyeriana var. granulata]|uniref:Uncharacterized protein n=1 Tax=Oryza meyeriana var. granulata TaxID=110450 RepID=A0A6G1C995_9ORYZ|nr:hypothetical protein E2562_032382 [Oryza meyeriana var. granulata]